MLFYVIVTLCAATGAVIDRADREDSKTEEGWGQLRNASLINKRSPGFFSLFSQGKSTAGTTERLVPVEEELSEMEVDADGVPDCAGRWAVVKPTAQEHRTSQDMSAGGSCDGLVTAAAAGRTVNRSLSPAPRRGLDGTVRDNKEAHISLPLVIGDASMMINIPVTIVPGKDALGAPKAFSTWKPTNKISPAAKSIQLGNGTLNFSNLFPRKGQNFDSVISEFLKQIRESQQSPIFGPGGPSKVILNLGVLRNPNDAAVVGRIARGIHLHPFFFQPSRPFPIAYF